MKNPCRDSRPARHQPAGTTGKAPRKSPAKNSSGSGRESPGAYASSRTGTNGRNYAGRRRRLAEWPRRGVLCARYSLLIAGYIRPLPPPASQARPGPADGDRARPATPDHKTAPAQDSTHTRTGAKQNRARGRRYSLDTPRRLRVRERRIFLDVKEIFPLPSAGWEKVRGSPKIGD